MRQYIEELESDDSGRVTRLVEEIRICRIQDGVHSIFFLIT